MTPGSESMITNWRGWLHSGLGVPIFMMVLLAMMVVPLPPFLLDILFTFNIALSLVILLTGVYSQKPLDFASFPTILLLATLLRLALNIASTRLILMEGQNGTGAAGNVIHAFGEFVIGGNYAVGFIVFSILVIINFVVVTKGAGRISEVSARFTLDAMPGKQMAVDADLNAGAITAEEAKERRKGIVEEADFYGSMDGASKFVKGDAIAGILILLINLIAGFVIGMLQHDMAFSDAVRTYTLLTIGDGLVTQIPALVLSVAAAIMVTRVSSAQDMGKQILVQLFDSPRALAVAASVLGVMGIIPGMPNVAFLTLAVIAGGTAYMIAQRRQTASLVAAPLPLKAMEPNAEPRDLDWDDVMPVDTIGLEVGYRLIPLVDKNQGGQLMGRIKGVRKKLTQELGFLVPSVHIRDNLELAPNAYRISLLGAAVGEAEIYPERDLAINPGQVFGALQGLPGKDPAFGLPATWIEPGQREHAQTLGYTVVDAGTVVATHLSQLLQSHAHEILGREEVQQLLNNLAKTAPKLVEDLVPNTVSLGVMLKVLQNLLEERVSIRDIRTIAETLAGYAPKSQDPAMLTTAVRVALGRLIVQQINGMASEIPVITLDPGLEQILQNSIQTSGSTGIGLEPGLAERMHSALVQSVQRQELAGQPAILLVPMSLRLSLARLVRHSITALHVLAYNEIPDNKQIRIVATVGK